MDVATLEVLERIAVLSCERRGPVVDLLLDRAQNRRAQFVFTQVRGRPSIFWQTAKAIANARPGLRVPQRKSRTIERIVIDTRERYGYGFKRFGVEVERTALRAGDYAAFVDGGAVATAVIERKTMDDFCGSLVDGTLGFVMAELARSPTTAVRWKARTRNSCAADSSTVRGSAKFSCDYKCGTRQLPSYSSRRVRSENAGRTTFSRRLPQKTRRTWIPR